MLRSVLIALFAIVCFSFIPLSQAVMLPAHAQMLAADTQPLKHASAAHGEHAGHSGQHSAQPEQPSDCAWQMGATCMQLCSLSALPNAELPLTHAVANDFSAVAHPAPQSPYLERPFPPPRS